MTNTFRTMKASWLVLAALCLSAAGLMFWSSAQESATMDELAHIPSGYSYVRYLDFRLNPEHPPLLKALAGFPLLFVQPTFPTDHKAWTTDVNGQWDMGRALLYESGNDADQIVHVARTGPILLTIGLIILVYIWAAELIGRRWALLPAALFGLSPNILAHGHYVTTDVAAAFGVVLASYFFIRLLHSPTRRSLVLAGVGFGIAQLMKFSAVLLIPYFFLLAGVFGLVQGIRAAQGMGWFARAKQMAWYAFLHLTRTGGVMVIGYVLLVYPMYFLFTVGYPPERQHTDTSFILKSFADGPTPDGKYCKPARCLADLNVWMSDNPVLRPFAEYELGVLMVLQRSSGGNRNYFLGEVADGGWHHYFPVVYALKEPLAVVCMVLVALLVGLWRVGRDLLQNGFGRTRHVWNFIRSGPGIGALSLAVVLGAAYLWVLKGSLLSPIGIALIGLVAGIYALRTRWTRFLDWLGVNFAEFAMLVFIVFYWAWSIQSPLNIGFRHLFPTLPFIYILVAGFWKRFLTAIRVPQTPSIIGTLWYGLKAIFTSSLKYLAFIFLVAWFLVQSVVAAPYYLSYFNELAGGPGEGYRYVTDSNYDWGQDLARLRQFVADHPDIQKVAVHYFGGGQPSWYLGDKNENWWSARGNPADEGIHYLAISVNELQGSIHTVRTVTDPNGTTRPEFYRKPEDSYEWLTKLRPIPDGMGSVPEPDYRVGTSLFVYKL